VIPPETQYTKVDGAWVGYQVIGDGPIDLVYVSGMASNIETMWDYPTYARALERMASYSRLIAFDSRGSGISDPVPFGGVLTWEYWTQDLVAVLQAAKSERTSMIAQFDGGIPSILFAATYPERTASLVLWHCFARSIYAEDYPIGQPREAAEMIWDMVEQAWGTPASIQAFDPDFAADPEHLRLAAKYLRTAMTPGRAAATMRNTSDVDVRHVLPAVRVPTLVLHRRGYPYIPTEQGRYLADHIAGARFVDFAGSNATLWSDTAPEIEDEIEEFLTGSRPLAPVDRVLATVLFTDIVGSTEKASALGDRRWREILAIHDRVAREHVDRFSGRLVNTMGDGILATFDGPGRAIRCAHALGRALEPVGVKIRAGLHTGEIELRDEGDVGGIAVHIAARVMHEAGPGEVICSRTVKDLVAGSEFLFEDRGVCALKGVPDEWQLYSVNSK